MITVHNIDNLGDKDAIEQEVRAGGAEVIKCKGATYYAIALSVSQIAEAILRDTKMILTVSTLQDGSRYGVKDVCLSLPCVVGANGIEREITPPLLPDKMDYAKESLEAALRLAGSSLKLHCVHRWKPQTICLWHIPRVLHSLVWKSRRMLT